MSSNWISAWTPHSGWTAGWALRQGFCWQPLKANRRKSNTNMAKQPLFAGLVFDESNRPAETALVGDEPCYVVDDAGFRRHIPSEQVDRQVLDQMAEMMKGSEDLLSEQAAKMLGQEDVFTVAAIQQQLKHMDKQF